MLVQPRILQDDGSETLLDELLRAGFSVIGVNCMVEAALHAKDQGELTSFANRLEAILIVRPDRFVADS